MDVLSRVLEQAGPGIAEEDLDHIAVAAGDQDAEEFISVVDESIAEYVEEME